MPRMIGFPELLLVLVFMGGTTAFWLWMLYDCARHEPEGRKRAMWTLIMALGHFLGALAYLFYGRRRSRGLTRVT